MKALVSAYKKKRHEIKKRLKEFSKKGSSGDSEIFPELCFCILTPQAKAVYCNAAVEDLRKSGLLFKGCQSAISKKLKGRVRFHNNKAAYLIAARRLFSAQGAVPAGRQGSTLGGKSNRGLDIKRKLDRKDVLKTREWLVSHVKGLGYKEASHFLRNIGLGKDIAIIDRHILRNLKRCGIIRDIPKSISRRTYLDIEEKMRAFSRRIRIPLGELDLLFWSSETGFVFK